MPPQGVRVGEGAGTPRDVVEFPRTQLQRSAIGVLPSL